MNVDQVDFRGEWMNINLKGPNRVKVLRNKKMWYLIALHFLWWGLLTLHVACVAEQTTVQPIHAVALQRAISEPHLKPRARWFFPRWPSHERECVPDMGGPGRALRQEKCLNGRSFWQSAFLILKTSKTNFFLTFHRLNPAIKFQQKSGHRTTCLKLGHDHTYESEN